MITLGVICIVIGVVALLLSNSLTIESYLQWAEILHTLRPDESLKTIGFTFLILGALLVIVKVILNSTQKKPIVASNRCLEIQCPHCHSFIPRGHNFCGNCGNKVSLSYCRMCGTVRKDGAQFCSQCGTSFSDQ